MGIAFWLTLRAFAEIPCKDESEFCSTNDQQRQLKPNDEQRRQCCFYGGGREVGVSCPNDGVCGNNVCTNGTCAPSCGYRHRAWCFRYGQNGNTKAPPSTAEGCETACTNATNCTKWTWLNGTGGRSTCYLMDKAHLFARMMAVTPQEEPEECVSGFKCESWRRVGSLKECEKWAQRKNISSVSIVSDANKGAGCQFSRPIVQWNWNEDGEYASEEDISACAIVSEDACNTTLEGIDFFGGDMHREDSMEGVEACIRLCTDKPECILCTWNSKKNECHLKNTEELPTLHHEATSWRKCIHGDWGEWGECTKLCGGTQTRLCNNPAPLYGGKNCTGNTLQSCHTTACPINCEWHNWTLWSQCTLVCGTGTQTRSRSKKTEKVGDGDACLGDSQDTQSCNTRECAVTTTGIPPTNPTTAGWRKSRGSTQTTTSTRVSTSIQTTTSSKFLTSTSIQTTTSTRASTSTETTTSPITAATPIAPIGVKTTINIRRNVSVRVAVNVKLPSHVTESMLCQDGHPFIQAIKQSVVNLMRDTVCLADILLVSIQLSGKVRRCAESGARLLRLLQGVEKRRLLIEYVLSVSSMAENQFTDVFSGGNVHLPRTSVDIPAGYEVFSEFEVVPIAQSDIALETTVTESKAVQDGVTQGHPRSESTNPWIYLYFGALPILTIGCAALYFSWKRSSRKLQYNDAILPQEGPTISSRTPPIGLASASYAINAYLSMRTHAAKVSETAEATDTRKDHDGASNDESDSIYDIASDNENWDLNSDSMYDIYSVMGWSRDSIQSGEDVRRRDTYASEFGEA